MDLQAEPIGIVDRRTKNYAIEPGPQRIGHAHRARLAGGIHRIAGKRWVFQFLASKADGAGFGVGARIAFPKDGVGGAHEAFTRARVYDERAERHWTGRNQGARRKLINFAHALFVHGRTARS